MDSLPLACSTCSANTYSRLYSTVESNENATPNTKRVEPEKNESSDILMVAEAVSSSGVVSGSAGENMAPRPAKASPDVTTMTAVHLCGEIGLLSNALDSIAVKIKLDEFTTANTPEPAYTNPKNAKAAANKSTRVKSATVDTQTYE
jgi:hypothetical protein